MERCEEARVRGNDAYARREWDSAISAYGAGISARAASGLPPDRRLFSNRAAAYVSKYLAVRDAGLQLRGLLALAVNDASAATAVAPEWPKGWYRLYVAHAAAGDLPTALAAVRKGLAHCPADPDLSRAAQALASSGAADPAPVATSALLPLPGDTERCAADAALRAGDWRTAIAGYSRSINTALRAGSSPDRRAYCSRSAAWLHAAVLTDEESAFTAAIADADRCIAMDDAWPKAWYRKAAAYLEDGRPGCAKDVFEDGLKRCPADPELRAGLMQATRVIEEEGAETDWEDAAVRDKLPHSSLDDDDDADSEASSVDTKTEDGDGRGVNFRVLGKIMPEPYHAPVSQFAQKFTTPTPIASPQCHAESTTDSSSRSLSVNEVTERNAEASTPVRVSMRSAEDSDRHDAVDYGVLRETQYDERNISWKRGKHRRIVGERPRSVQIEKRAVPRQQEDSEDEVQAIARRMRSAPTVNAQEAALDELDVVEKESGDDEHEPRRSTSLRSSIRNEGDGRDRQPGSMGGEKKESWADWNETSGSSGDEKPKASQVTDSLYELLGVSRTASESEIKRAYYELARRLHPDKNPDDSEATAKFQRLADAYRVLSDPKSRALYDKYGERELARNGVQSVDPSTLFAMVFGSDHFGHLIGELQVASLANTVDENGNAPPTDVLERIQKERVGNLAVHLIRMVQRWVDGQREDFAEWASTEARRLAEANFGVQLLHVVGRAYVACAAVSRAAVVGASRRGVRGLSASISGAVAGGLYRTQRARAQLRASAAASRVMSKQRRMHDRVLKLGRGGRALSAQEAERMAVEMAECAVDMMWKLAVVDIETTVADVVAAVLSGKDVDEAEEEARDRVVALRAAALRVLGRAFCAVRAPRSDTMLNDSGAAVTRGDHIGRRLGNLRALGTRTKV